jgi:CRISPR-associated protein Cmr1
MQKLEYRVCFNTPAFLGNAEQAGQWRTPPVKALLRQWWRVVYAAGRHGERDLVTQMRHAEGHLFGVASDAREGSSKSLIRLRLDRWDLGRQRNWQGLDTQRVTHPEVQNPIGSQLYLGYGPLGFAGGQTALKANAAIQVGEEARLSLAFPEQQRHSIQQALALMHRYGTLGGRSRNGWGSFALISADDQTPALDTALDPAMLRLWRDALALDWPHAIGRDATGPLIWQSEPFLDCNWKAVMYRLAKIKIGLRTQFRFSVGNRASQPEARHWLSYPVTRHSVSAWGNARLPNSLRFKVRPDPNGRLLGVIAHVPCLPPDTDTARFRPDRPAIESVWQRVHAFLDHPTQGLARVLV